MKITNLIHFQILMGHPMELLYCPMGQSTALWTTLRTLIIFFTVLVNGVGSLVKSVHYTMVITTVKNYHFTTTL